MKDPGQEILDRTNHILELTKKRIDDFLAGIYPESFGSVSLAKDIVKQTGYPLAMVQSIVSQYHELHDEIESVRGPKGGTRRKKVE